MFPPPFHNINQIPLLLTYLFAYDHSSVLGASDNLQNCCHWWTPP